MGITVVSVLAGETPYMPHLNKKNEIGVIISYALISLKHAYLIGLQTYYFGTLT